MKNLKSNPVRLVSFWVFLLFLVSGQGWTQTTVWNVAGPADWNTAGNWTSGLPDAATAASIRNGGTSVIDGFDAFSNSIAVGNHLGSGQLQIINGGSLTMNSTIFAPGIGLSGIGGVLVDASTLNWINAGTAETLQVGNSGGDGTLTITNGGSVSVNDSGTGDGRIILGRFGGTATLNIGTGGGAGILNAAVLSTNGESGGTSGTGIINFNHSDTDYYFTKDGTSTGTGVQITQRIAVNHIGTGKTTLTGQNTYSGGTTVKSGTLAVSGAGASIEHASADLRVGDSDGDTGAFLLNGGRLITANGYIGYDGGSSGSVTVTSGTWINGNHLYIGRSGTGSLVISGGLVSSALSAIATGGRTGIVTMTGGTWNNSDRLIVGASGTGTLNFSGGVIMTDTSVIGLNTTGVGSALVSGGVWSSTGGGLLIGGFGTGSLRIVGGLVRSSQVLMATQSVASGTLRLDGGVLETGSVWKVFDSASFFFAGGTLRATAGTNNFLRDFEAGDVTIDTSGAFIDSNGFDIAIGTSLGGVGTLTKLGAGTLTLTGSNSYGGGTVVRSGTLALVGSGAAVTHSAADLRVGASNGDDGSLLLSDGGRVVVGSAMVGDAPGAQGAVRISGSASQLSVADFLIGHDGSGSLLVEDGGTFEDRDGMLGSVIGIDGLGSLTVSGTGSSFLMGSSGLLYVGANSAQAILNIFDGGNASLGTVIIATTGSGSVSVSGTGSVLSASTVAMGLSSGASGTLTLRDGGAAVVSGTVAVGSNGTAALNIGDFDLTTSGGTLTTAALDLRALGRINFNQTDATTFAINISGSGQVFQRGSGTTTLTGTNTYTGNTSVTGGKLVVNRVNSGTGAVSVGSGAALGGTGTIAGAVTVADGGILSPGNSAGTLSVASLSLNATSILDYELGAPADPNDRIDVLGDLALDGILNITDLGGFGPGEYLLMTYGGSLTDNGLLFGLVPGAYDFSLDTTGNEVNLTVTLATAQYWNGPNESPVPGSPTGGSGTWNNALTNWTNAAGEGNAAWTGALPAIFTGTAGTVTVAEEVEVAEMRFLTDGYVVTGTGALAISGTTLTLLADPDVIAEIETVITGTGGVLKNGAGEVILSGSNAYAGGTHVAGGTLLVNDDFALGTGPLALADGTTFGVKDTLVVLDNNVSVEGDVSIRAAAGLDFSGTMSLGAAARTLTFTEDFSSVCFMGPITGDGGLSLLTEDGFTVDLTMCGPESNSYTGLTTVGSGVELLLMKDPDDVAIAGDLLIQDNAFVEVLELEESSVTQIAPASSVTIEGTGQLSLLYLPLDPVYSPLEQTLAGLFGDGTFSSEAGSVNLTVLEGNFSGVITDGDPCGCGGDPLALFKSGAETLILSGSNSYRGGTTIRQGTLQTDHVSALGSGPVALTGGNFEPLSALTIDSMDWSGGTVARTLDTTAELMTILNDLTVTGAGGTFDFTVGAGFLPNLTFDLLSAANLDLSMLGLFSGNALFGLAPVFSIDGDTLEVTFVGTPIVTGAILQNSAPVGIPTFAEFLVNGPVTTGTPTESNTIRSLLFNPGSSLQIFNTLTVTTGEFTAPTGSATVTGGNVVVPGTFSKQGAGLLNVFSNVFVNGPANVVAGSLLVNGSFTTGGGLTVFQNALLGGAGVINGDVTNNGIVAPGNSPGTLTVNGNYTQTASGTLQIEPGDLLLVSGRASLAGTLQLVAAGKLKYGRQIAFLRAGSISGEFDEILMPNPNRFRGRFLAEDGVGTLLVAPTSYTLVAETTNQRNVARALDGYIPARGDDRETVSVALDLQSEEQYPAAFDQIAPTYYESLGNITIEQAFVQSQQLNQRFSAVRLGARGFQSIGISSPLLHDKDGKSVLEAKDALSTLTPQLSTNWSIWAMGNGLFGKVTNVSQVPNYNFNSGGFLVGGDYRWSENFVTGLYGGYQYTWADAGDAGNTQINSALFGGYASYTNGGFYADGIVGGGYNGYRVRRGITFSTIDRTARSQPNGGQFNTSLNLGYDWEIGKFTLGPIAGVQYAYAGIAPFSETGADSLDLRVAQQNINSLRTTFGGRVAYTWNVTDKIALIPEVRMFWQHEFLNNPRNISSALDGGAGPTFGYETSAPARDSVFAGAGVSAQFGERWNAFVYWNVDFGRQDYLGNSVSGGLNWKF